MISKVKLQQYYHLTKPGIVYGNSITGAAGFIFASQGDYSFVRFVSFMIGLAFVIASACVFNNFTDQRIDAKMTRTKKRELVRQSINNRDALIFGSTLLLIGLSSLLFLTTILATTIAVIGFVSYVFLYGLAKRKTVFGTLIGSIPGATPPVGGYVAVTNNLDVPATILFLVLVCWQMPHFYAIAIFRLKEYKSAGIPVLPAVRGIKTTKLHMLSFNILFIIACTSLFMFGFAGYSYLIATVAAGIFWLRQCIYGFSAQDDVEWAKKFFGISLLVLLTFSLMISITYYLP